MKPEIVCLSPDGFEDFDPEDAEPRLVISRAIIGVTRQFHAHGAGNPLIANALRDALITHLINTAPLDMIEQLVDVLADSISKTKPAILHTAHMARKGESSA